ncbi:MAG: hypothetical protein MZV65_38770 [Chromatiales bacterium]|nr:hypothetical protein [Chromatiales bacterium]
MKMKTDIFPGFLVSRDVSIENDLAFSICDCVENKKNQELTQYRTRFIVPRDKEIVVREGCIQIKKGSLSLGILIFSDIEFNVVLSSILISRNFNKIVSAQAVDINYESLSLNVTYKCVWFFIN